MANHRINNMMLNNMMLNMPSAITSHSLRLLLLTSIDYEGLFSPQSLDFRGAITSYERHCMGTHRWMLGRFVLELGHLSSFSDQLNRSLERSPAPLLWPLSVVIQPSLQALQELSQWLRKRNPFAIAALEFKPTSPDIIANLLPHIPPNIDLFFELPSTPTPDQPPLSAYLDVLKGTQAAAKIQVGGVASSHIPSISSLAHLIVACAEAKVPFKAATGLHYPLRSIGPLPNGNLAQMHGFLNVALAATVAYSENQSPEDIAAILRIASAQSINFTHQSIVYQTSSAPNHSSQGGEIRSIPLEALSQVRSQFFRGISSSSVQTPLNELYHLGLLTEVNPIDTISISIPQAYALSS